MLPKIPVITDRQAQRPNTQPQPQISSSSTTSTEPKPQTPTTHYSSEYEFKLTYSSVLTFCSFFVFFSSRSRQHDSRSYSCV